MSMTTTLRLNLHVRWHFVYRFTSWEELVEFRKALLNRKQLYSIYFRDNENETPRITNKLRFEKVLGLPWWLVGKESTCQCGLFSGLGRSLGEGNGNPFQYSCLGDPMDRGT